MKKFLTLIIILVAILTTASAQGGQGTMTFVGKSNFYVTMRGTKAGETQQLSDTITYSGADFKLPSMKYGDMIIPSFEIKGTTFSGGYAGVVWEDQTFSSTTIDSEGNEKAITGLSFKGSLSHDNGIYKVSIEATFNYGTMPFPITYSIESYYVKDYAGRNSVIVGGQFGPYTTNLTHKIRTYTEDGTTKMDVEIPTYKLAGTVMGDLTIGTYTVTGLTYDDTQGGYYKDYSSDGLKMHFKAESNGTATMDADYALSAAGKENILVVISNGKAKITNNFQPGSMPFPICAIMDQNSEAGIVSINKEESSISGAEYNISGQRVSNTSRGIIIKNGKKYTR